MACPFFMKLETVALVMWLDPHWTKRFSNSRDQLPAQQKINRLQVALWSPPGYTSPDRQVMGL